MFDLIKSQQRFAAIENDITSFFFQKGIKEIKGVLNKVCVHIEVFFFLGAVDAVVIAGVSDNKGKVGHFQSGVCFFHYHAPFPYATNIFNS
jgi:hypothetical protein